MPRPLLDRRGGIASALTERLLPLRKNDLHRKEAVLALGGQSTFIFLDDAVRHFDGIVGGAGVSGLRRTVGADDVHHHEALTGADQQVDAAALRLGHLHGTLDGVVEHASSPSFHSKSSARLY